MRPISRAEREASSAIVDAIHPGGGTLRPVARETPAQRLTRLESELLDLAIETSLQRDGEMRDLAVSIIALRAQVAG